MGSPLQALDAGAFARWLELAADRLEQERDRLDTLNVFPVPDADTGTNLWLTLQAACRAVTSARRRPSLRALSSAAARGALMGARGNSGVIFSQFLLGLASHIKALPRGARLDGPALAQALEAAYQAAYTAVMRPVEGTILTAGREAARSAREATQGSDRSLSAVVEAAVAGASRAVRESPGLLAPLARAGVVDAGAEGLRLVLEALREVVRAAGEGAQGAEAGLRADARGGQAACPAGTHAKPSVEAAAPPAGTPHPRYCTQLVLRGPGVEVRAVRREAGRWGESVAVAGDEGLVKVHLHTHRPAEVIEAMRRWGEVVSVAVLDMCDQNREAAIGSGSDQPGVSGGEPPKGRRRASGRDSWRAGNHGAGGGGDREGPAAQGTARAPGAADGRPGAPVPHGHPAPVD